MKFKTDKFTASRGGKSQLLDISCRKCETNVLSYQKDGPGNLRRMYMDRIFEPAKLQKNQLKSLKDISPLRCPGCKEILAQPVVFQKEKRNAYRLFVDSVIKKRISLKSLKS
jgi:hypothetical protein